jgi:hypothetical protein
MNIPFRNADHNQMRKLFKMLRSTVDCPNADRLRKDLSKEADKVREQIKEELRGIKKVSLALDGWTSPNKLAFLAIVVYYITPDWKYRHALIAFEQLSGSHSGTYLNQVLEEKTKQYEIYEKILAITTDNASNNDTLYKSLTSAIRRAIGKMHFQVIHIPCLAHVVQLSVKAFLDNIKIEAENESKSKSISTTAINDAGKMEKGFKRTLTLVCLILLVLKKAIICGILGNECNNQAL